MAKTLETAPAPTAWPTRMKRRLAAGGYGALWLALCVLAAVPVFWFGLGSLGAAWATPEYSHGPLIPVLSAYLFLRHLRRVPAETGVPPDRWPGVALILLGLTIGVFGNLVRIPDITTYGLIVWVAGLILLSFGFSRGVVFWASVLHLVYMLPLPQFLYWHLTIQLQFLSSEIGVAALRLVGVSVLLEGNIIDLAVYKLQVAEACSGLRYLFPILSFSYVFCVLYNGPLWHRVVILVSAAPITVLMNAFRIAVIGVMVDRFGISYAEGFMHLFEGWVIFLACVALLFLLAIAMQRLQPRPKPLADTLDIDFDGLGPQALRVLDIRRSPAVIAAAGLSLALLAGFWAVPSADPVRPDRAPFVLFPTTLGAWQGQGTRLDPEIAQVLGADDYISAIYRQPSQPQVDLFVAYYHKLTEGSGIHSPEVCIPAAGWEIAALEPMGLDLPASGWPPFQLNRAVIEKGLQQQLVYFWFEQRGRRITNDYAAKAATVWDSLRTGRTDGALVRFVTPIVPGEAPGAADARLQALMAEALPALPRFVPGG